jgi:hypothetical protein
MKTRKKQRGLPQYQGEPGTDYQQKAGCHEEGAVRACFEKEHL